MVKGSGRARRPVAPLPPSPAALRQTSGLILHLCLRVAVAASHLDATHLDTFIGAEAQEQRKTVPPACQVTLRTHLAPVCVCVLFLG